MNEIVVGALVLSSLHALIPSHWLPFVTIGKAEVHPTPSGGAKPCWRG